MSSPPSTARDERDDGQVDERRRGHRGGEVAGVAGADEDAVEDEDRGGDRLERRDEPQHLLGERLDRPAVGEKRDEDRVAAAR